MTSGNQGFPSDDVRHPPNAIVRSSRHVGSPSAETAPSTETDFVDLFARLVVVKYAWDRFGQAVAERVEEYESGRRPW